LAVDIDNLQSVVKQEESVRRMVDEGAKPRLARAQLLLRQPELSDILQDPELA
jgi:3-methyladenine DNA glycosylase AlkC